LTSLQRYGARGVFGSWVRLRIVHGFSTGFSFSYWKLWAFLHFPFFFTALIKIIMLC
jgi:hypothetical protein